VIRVTANGTTQGLTSYCRDGLFHSQNPETAMRGILLWLIGIPIPIIILIYLLF